MALKLLICGDVKGKLDDLYKKIPSLEKKSGKLDILFCVGDFFGSDISFLDDYIQNKKSSTLETFIISPLPEAFKSKIDEKGTELCRNITYLGYKGLLKFKNKLNIAFLSSENIIQNNDIKELSNQLMCTNISYAGIDILFTHLWPTGIENGSTKLPNNQSSSQFGNELISALAALIQPRYHFSAGKDIFYERQPYKNQKSNFTKQKHVTRFIALSSYKNKNNDKFLYAMQLKPMELMSQEELLQVPSNCTDNPFLSVNTDNVLSVPKQQFFYDVNTDRKRKADLENSDNDKRKKTNISDGCWFCLGNPEVEKHLIVHIGKEVYIAMPRGPLNDEHLLILTVGHFQSFITCPKEVSKEMRKLMRVISKYFCSKGKSVVFFERNFKTQHFQMQVVAIDSDKLDDCKNLFLEMAGDEIGPGEDFIEIPSRTKLEEIVKPHVPYFYVEFSDGCRFFGIIPRQQLSTFDLQFGRIVLSHRRILNCPEKSQWKNCTEDRNTEERLVGKIKKSLSEVL